MMLNAGGWGKADWQESITTIREDCSLGKSKPVERHMET